MLKFSQLEVKRKRKGKVLIKVTYNEDEVSRFENVWDTKKTKESNQYASVSLNKAIDNMIVHLMYGSELISPEIKLNKDLDYPLWFKDQHFKDDERFSFIEITKVQFFGNEKADSIKIFGYRETQLTDKAFKVNIETPVINLDKSSENYYKLVTILSDQVDDLQTELEHWSSKGDTLTKEQQLSFFEQVKAEA